MKTKVIFSLISILLLLTGCREEKLSKENRHRYAQILADYYIVMEVRARDKEAYDTLRQQLYDMHNTDSLEIEQILQYLTDHREENVEIEQEVQEILNALK